MYNQFPNNNSMNNMFNPEVIYNQICNSFPNEVPQVFNQIKSSGLSNEQFGRHLIKQFNLQTNPLIMQLLNQLGIRL